MHIGIDCSCVAKPERTGVARYCVALLKTLPEAIGPEDRVTLLYRFSRLSKRSHFERVDDPRFSVRVFHDRVIPFGARGLDVVHGPDLRIPEFQGVPAVSTVHDLGALHVPGIAKESFKKRKRQALDDVAHRAAAILCISDFTEQALLHHFPEATGRTRVIPLGLAPRFSPRSEEKIAGVRSQLGLRGRYLLFVGQIAPRKNLGPLLDAHASLRLDPAFQDLELVLAGPVHSGDDAVLDRIRTLGADGGVHLPGYVGDDVLPSLYSGAAVFCFTGKAEGFGLPILEAMACGVPVIVAHAGASESTAGGAAIAVDPDDANELRMAIADLLRDSSARDDLRRRGFERSHEFSWRVTARRTVEAYGDAARAGVPR